MHTLRTVFFVLLFIAFHGMVLAIKATNNTFIYYNDVALQAVKSEIGKGNSFFYDAYTELLASANVELNKNINPVTNKTQMPPSGDKHDYLSLAPYWWPDPSKPDGLPWIRKDGQVNPETRGNHTDQVRTSEMFKSLEKLAFAYYFSGDDRYAQKAQQIIRVWFINEDTRMNPNLKYGQGVPGSVDGRAAGIIEFVGVSSLITALQMLEHDSVLTANEMQVMKTWMTNMVIWLTTHEYGVKEGNANNNHGNWYDFQVLGIYLYIGDMAKATQKAESIKINRIKKQIKPDGSQPEELGRTKSVNYSNMNLWAMTRLCIMAKTVNVDLWNYQSSDGRSIRRAYEFLIPYILKEKEWTWEQIIGGGAGASIEKLMVNTCAKGSSIFNETILPTKKTSYNKLSYLEKLQYPPLEKLAVKDTNNPAPYLFFANPTADTTLLEGYDAIPYKIIATGSEGTHEEIKLRLCVNGISLKNSNGTDYLWTNEAEPGFQQLQNLKRGKYELKAVATDSNGAVSQKFLTLTVNQQSGSFYEAPHTIPGSIEAEDFDKGGEDVAYHDSDEGNAFGEYRNDDVDIKKLDDNQFYVANIYPREWMHYTVDVAEEGYYDFEIVYATLRGGEIGAKWFGADTVIFKDLRLPVTKRGWTDFKTATYKQVWLPKGERILRIDMESGGYNLDKINIKRVIPAYAQINLSDAIKVYPNPAESVFTIQLSNEAKANVFIYNTTGELVYTKHQASGVLHINNLPGTGKGLHLVTIESEGIIQTTKLMMY